MYTQQVNSLLKSPLNGGLSFCTFHVRFNAFNQFVFQCFEQIFFSFVTVWGSQATI